jgi:hypothetical protein
MRREGRGEVPRVMVCMLLHNNNNPQVNLPPIKRHMIGFAAFQFTSQKPSGRVVQADRTAFWVKSAALDDEG